MAELSIINSYEEMSSGHRSMVLEVARARIYVKTKIVGVAARVRGTSRGMMATTIDNETQRKSTNLYAIERSRKELLKPSKDVNVERK